MRLSTRLSLFFQCALAVVLLGFSLALYVLASRYLHRQADERLDAALNTLAAAAEIGPQGVEWEPSERSLSFGRRIIEGHFAWAVCDDRGRRLDGSTSAETDQFLARTEDANFRHPRVVVDARGVPWRVLWRRLTPAAVAGTAFHHDPEDEVHPPTRYPELSLAAAVSMEPVLGTLRTLGLVLTGLSLALWTLSLLVGRQLSRRALLPLTTMAEAALVIRGDEPHQRLPEAASRDELQELAQSINGLLSRLQESFERQRRFTGDASHQLRTPLTAIQGQVDLALRQDRDSGEYRRVLGVVQRKTRHLRQIVESLLFLARADGEMMEPLLEPIDLTAWLSEHVDSWRESHAGNVPPVEIEAQGPVPVRVQPSLLGELVNNLLDNAIRHGDAAAPVQVRLKRDRDWVLLEIEDGGIGIEEDDLAHIFEPFYRSATARGRGTPGLGLGLSVAQRLATSFGGRIEVASRVGQGTRFTLRLPLDGQPEPVRGSPASSIEMAATKSI
jgi:signal transduction histidine kinase